MTEMPFNASECKICIKARVDEGNPPQHMVVLPNKTLGRKLTVKVCPQCDGDVAELAYRTP